MNRGQYRQLLATYELSFTEHASAIQLSGETNTVENKPDSSTFSHRSPTAIRTELNAFAENFSVEFCEGDEVCSNDPYKQILFFLFFKFLLACKMLPLFSLN